MQLRQIVRILRLTKNLTQEEMAKKIPMSTSGYIKLEQGENSLMSERLPRIAEIFGLNVVDLINMADKNIIYLVNENSQNSSNHYNSTESVITENEKLKLTIQHQAELLAKQEQQIIILQEYVELLKQHKGN